MDRFIYLDNAATTRTDKEVVYAMLPYLSEEFGNAASVYTFAGHAKKAVEESRRTIAEFIGAKNDEIYFTAGGSESDNWAVKGVALALQILVTADASKRIAATVEEEPLLRVAMENPAAKAG